MSVEFKRLPDEPIIISTTRPPLDLEKDAQESLQKLGQYLAEMTGTIYFISDLTYLDLGFTDVVLGLAVITQDPHSPLGQERLKTTIVGTQEMVKLAVTSMQQEQYGAIVIDISDSLDDSLAKIRAEIAAAN